MKIDEILKLVNAGYSKEEIDAFNITDPKPDPKPDPTGKSFDYDKFATALVKAQQLANGKTNFGGSNDKTDFSKFF